MVGHVDSGKTALCRALSTVQSTAGFDTHPEARRRGITLDIGFSKLALDSHQITLVDCPGHAQFIRSVLAGVRICDFVLLVIDGQKMFQQQTYEALVLAELLRLPTLACVNKADLLTQEQTQAAVTQTASLLQKTKIAAYDVCSASALGGDVGRLMDAMRQLVASSCAKILEDRAARDQLPTIMQYDHWFSQPVGTVFTCTVLQGSAHAGTQLRLVGDADAAGSIKQMQSFKQEVSDAKTGDRVGVCIKGLVPSSERGLLVDPRAGVLRGKQFVAKCSLSRHFPVKVKQGQHFSINVGSETLGARIYVFEKSVRAQLEESAEPKAVRVRRLGPEDITGKHAYTAILDFDGE